MFWKVYMLFERNCQSKSYLTDVNNGLRELLCVQTSFIFLMVDLHGWFYDSKSFIQRIMDDFGTGKVTGNSKPNKNVIINFTKSIPQYFIYTAV